MFTGIYTAIVTPLKEGKVDELAFERLIKAQLLGIAFANKQPDKTNAILADLARREKDLRPQTAERITRMPRKPYPELAAIDNAYQLACLQNPETKDISPLSLWDMHYLRDFDDSGFIDSLYA